jgi:formate dehydrogenase maturation protein FdhE
MAGKKPMDERVRMFVASVLAERPERDEHINDIELDMEELADAVADEFAAQLLARQAQSKASAACPDCGAAGQHVGERQRAITTTRGSAPLVEPKHYCPACRRHFFPSVRSTGPVG